MDSTTQERHGERTKQALSYVPRSFKTLHEKRKFYVTLLVLCKCLLLFVAFHNTIVSQPRPQNLDHRTSIHSMLLCQSHYWRTPIANNWGNGRWLGASYLTACVIQSTLSSSCWLGTDLVPGLSRDTVQVGGNGLTVLLECNVIGTGSPCMKMVRPKWLLGFPHSWSWVRRHEFNGVIGGPILRLKRA